MEETHNIFQGQFIKKDGKLIACSPTDIIYKNFIDSLQEGQKISIFMDSNVDNGTLAQIAKIHACIRELAIDLGYTFDEMKAEVKRRNGMLINNKYKSFADCSKEELALVIQSIIQIGDLANINFR